MFAKAAQELLDAQGELNTLTPPPPQDLDRVPDDGGFVTGPAGLPKTQDKKEKWEERDKNGWGETVRCADKGEQVALFSDGLGAPSSWRSVSIA